MGVITKNAYYGTPPVVTNGLIFYVDFVNPQSYISGNSIVRDLSVYGYSGSIISSGSNATPVPVQNGLYFTGSAQTGLGSGGLINFAQFITAPAAALLNVSIFAFCMPIVSGIQQMVISKDSGISAGSLRDFQLYITSANQVAVTFYSSIGDIGQTAGGGPIVPTNQWSYIGGVVNPIGPGGLTAYLNGKVLPTTGIAAGTGNSSTSPVQIGATSGSTGIFSAFNGYIGAVHIYQRTLSLTEIQQNFNALKSRYGLT